MKTTHVNNWWKERSKKRKTVTVHKLDKHTEKKNITSNWEYNQVIIKTVLKINT